MSEPLTQDTEPVEEHVSPQEERALERLERVVERHVPEPEESAPPAPAVAPEPTPRPATPEPESDAEEVYSRAHQEYRRRREEAHQREIATRLLRELDSGGRQPTAPAAAPEAEGGPAERPDPLMDPEAYERWLGENVVGKRLAPLLELAEQQQRRQAAEQQYRQRQQQEYAFEVETYRALAESAQDYPPANTPEVRQKYALFWGAPENPATGQPHYPGMFERGLIALNMDPQEARHFAKVNLTALTRVFIERGWNPAAAHHRFIDAQLGALREWSAAVQGGAAPAPAPTFSAAAEQVRQGRQAAQGAASVSGAPAAGGRSTIQPRTVADAIKANPSISLNELLPIVEQQFGVSGNIARIRLNQELTKVRRRRR